MCRKIEHDKDIESIENIWSKYNNKNWENLIKEIKCSKNDTYINEKDGKILAFLTIRNENVKDKQKNYIFEFYAVEKGKRYGEKLLKKMKKEREFLILHASKKETGLINRYKTMVFKKNEKYNTDEKYCMIWNKPNKAVKESKE